MYCIQIISFPIHTLNNDMPLFRLRFPHEVFVVHVGGSVTDTDQIHVHKT